MADIARGKLAEVFQQMRREVGKATVGGTDHLYEIHFRQLQFRIETDTFCHDVLSFHRIADFDGDGCI